MPVDVCVRHDRLLREQEVEMFEKGFGYRLTAKRLRVPAEAVRHWQKTYRVIGRDGFLAMGAKQAKYDYETKVAAARAVVDGGMSKPEAMTRFGIASATVRAVPPTREEELAERVRKLEAQVAYLKKSIALKAHRRSQTGTKP